VFDAYFNVWETLEIQSGYFGLNNNEDKINEVLVALGLDDKKEMNIRELSGGMKRRLLIAKALVHDPEIVVLDEPTAGVDVELRTSLWDYVRKLNAQGKTIILTTHYLEEAETLCDRIAILDKGEVVAVDTKEELINSIDKKVIEVKFIPQEISEAKLQPYNYQLDTEKGQLELETSRAQVQDIIELLTELNLEIIDVEISSAKLEDVFRKLTRLGGEAN
jgi:ABC-2 type transport system ATP-binding protein